MDIKTKEFIGEKIKEIIELRKPNVPNKRQIIKKLTEYVSSFLENTFTDFGDYVAIKGRDNQINLCSKVVAQKYYYRFGKREFTPSIYPDNIDKMTINKIKLAARKSLKIN
jgi:hypothetical protein